MHHGDGEQYAERLHAQARPLDQIDLRKADNGALPARVESILQRRGNLPLGDDLSPQNFTEQIIHSRHVVLTVKAVVVN